MSGASSCKASQVLRTAALYFKGDAPKNMLQVPASCVSMWPPHAHRAAQGARRRPQRGMRGSYVPDHVRNPGKYTCYALEEPLIIGSGGGGGDALGDTGQARPSILLIRIACCLSWSMCISWHINCKKLGEQLVGGGGGGGGGAFSDARQARCWQMCCSLAEVGAKVGLRQCR